MRRPLVAAVLITASLVQILSAGEPAHEVLTHSGNSKSELNFRDADHLVYVEETGPRQWAIMQLTLSTGTVERLHPDFKYNQFGPAFSPDGKHFAYLKNVGNLNLRLVIRNLESGAESEFGEGGFSGMQAPCFSADSQRLFYAYPTDGRQQIWSCNLQCDDRKILVDSSGINNWPSCSADGQLVFASSRSGNYELYLQSHVDTPPRQVTSHSLMDIRPRINASGTEIVFTSTRSGNYDIYKLRSADNEPVRITSNPERDDYACWHPDGRIVYVEELDGQTEIVLSASE